MLNLTLLALFGLYHFQLSAKTFLLSYKKQIWCIWSALLTYNSTILNWQVSSFVSVKKRGFYLPFKLILNFVYLLSFNNNTIVSSLLEFLKRI